MIRDRRKSRLLLLLIGLLVCTLAPVTTGQGSAETRKVVELYPEYLDTTRFPGERQTELLHDYLLEKYSGKQIDVVVATPDPALSFLLKYRTDLFPTSPIVFVAVQRPSRAILTSGAGLT